MKQPITFVYRNLVFGREIDDVWALYRIETRSYDGLSAAQKREVMAELASFGYAVEADFQLLRVTRPWSPSAYARAAASTIDGRHGHPESWRSYLAQHQEVLASRPVAKPELYLAVDLGEPEAGLTAEVGRLVASGFDGLVAALKRRMGFGDPRSISDRQLASVLAQEERAFARSSDYLDCERASNREVQWLVRRALCRGLGEPEIDEQFLPQALIFEDPEGERRYKPLECDVLRLFECPVNVESRHLRIESELGECHQAFLAFGALPEVTVFPGRQAELLFAPFEAVDFPVDACFSARYVSNDRAVALARRRIIDADNTYGEESHGDHGPSAATSYRPEAARELEEYLGSESHPPLLRASISLALGAPTHDELEARVQQLRREYGSLKLHRPLGDQLRLFVGHLPAQRSLVRDYDDFLVVEQFGAMVPNATHAVGSEVGPYIGYTLSGSHQPVLFELTEASRTSRPPSILCAGTLGSGKTLFLQLLLYQAFLQGSRIVDIDPKGDHRLDELPGVGEHTEVIELSGDERYRGMLDPLRIAPAGTEEDLATSFLIDVLPAPMPAQWKTEIRKAVRRVSSDVSSQATCSLVIQALMRGGKEAKEAGSALAVYADTGLARLGFARTGSSLTDAGSMQVTSIRIRNLPRPAAGMARSELTEEERIGQAVLRLLAAYAMHLAGSDRSRHKVLGFDESWFLLQDSAGRRLIEHLNRWGRSEFSTPILATHLVSDAEQIDNLIGARFVFGMESDAEAAKALALLRLDPDDQGLRERLLSFRRGRCLMRDYWGRVGSIQVDLADASLLAALDTTPVETPASETRDVRAGLAQAA
jgi:hypothetical protein